MTYHIDLNQAGNEKAKMHTCNYYSGNAYLKCAINPTKTCLDCNEYEKKQYEREPYVLKILGITQENYWTHYGLLNSESIYGWRSLSSLVRATGRVIFMPEHIDTDWCKRFMEWVKPESSMTKTFKLQSNSFVSPRYIERKETLCSVSYVKVNSFYTLSIDLDFEFSIECISSNESYKIFID